MKIEATAIGDPDEDYFGKKAIHDHWKSYINAFNKNTTTAEPLRKT